MSLQSALLLLLPILTPLVGTSVAATIGQSHWPAWAKDCLAWFLVLAFAGGDMWANNQFAGGWFAILIDAEQTVTMLSSGWLVKLAPWLIWLNFLQNNLFNLVPLFEDALRIEPVTTRTVTTRAVPAAIPTPIILPSDASPIPQRASAEPTQPPSAN